MKKTKIFIAAILVLSLVIVPVLAGCAEEETSRLKVVTTTSLIARIVERVGGEMVDVVNIIPPAQCPGHFDVSPGDIKKLANAELFLLHGWQGEQFSDELIASADNTDLITVKINVKVGENTNWMTPEVQQAAVDKIAEALSQIDSENSAAYQKAAAEYNSEVEAKGVEIKARLAEEDLAGIHVMCAEQLTGLVRWTGLNIITTYGRPDSLTPEVVRELVDTGRESGVTLIIDNLQSGQDAGAGLAEELGCKRVIFTNFPGGFDNTETWEKALDYDANLVLQAISQ